MTDSALIDAIAQGGGWGVLGLLVLKVALDWVRKRIEDSSHIDSTIRKVNKIYRLLDELKSETKSDRVLIFRASNGGSIPRTSHPLKTTVLYETYDKTVNSVFEFWQYRPVDRHYIQILEHLVDNTFTILLPKDLPENTVLQRTYESLATASSILVPVKQTDEALFYIALYYQTKQDPKALEASVSKTKDYAHMLSTLIEE